MKINQLLLLSVFTFVFTSNAQNTNPINATSVQQATSFEIVQSIASRTYLEPADTSEKEIKDGRAGRNIVIIGKDKQTENDFLASNPHPLEQKISGKAPSLIFDAYTSNSTPTDPAGAVGPNHYIAVFNTGFRIFNKDGAPLTEQLNVTNIFPIDACCDLTVSYDVAIDRFVMTILSATAAGNSTNTVQVAVSQGPNPVNDGWFVYNFPMNTDYQKLSIWRDGYYLTANKNQGSPSTSEVVYALEREKMIVGNPNANIIGFPLPGITNAGFYSPQAFNVTDGNMPFEGGAPIVYMQDDAWSGVAQDHIKLWTVDVDWNTPSNSTISIPQEIDTTPFIAVFDGGSFSGNLTQPGGSDLDALQGTIMNQAQFRKFPNHNAAVFNFVVDADASSGEQAGIRWIELRQTSDTSPWTLYQEGTYISPNGKHAWNASLSMDAQGNIGMGYSAMGGSTNTKVSSYYTGRFNSDPTNTMTISEELIATSATNFSGNRYGDYSKIAIDPTDDKTFWYINEYLNSGRKGVVGVFKIAPTFNDDVGVINIDSPVSGALTNNEDIIVTIFNYGLNPASNFEISYQVDGSSIFSEIFSGTIASATSAQHTFSVPWDFSNLGHTYTITCTTDLTGDGDGFNDQETTQVKHLYPNDIGVVAITNPTTSPGLSDAEPITVTINNFGSSSQSNFDISYNLDGNIITEQVAGPLNGNSSISYTFSQTGDFSTFGEYNLSAYTSLSGDSETTNDSVSVSIENYLCTPISSCSYGDGFRVFELGSVVFNSDCASGGYSDFTQVSIDLEQGTTYDLTITTGYGDQHIRVWVDFNDDYVLTSDEIVVNDYVIEPGGGAGTYTETMDFIIPEDATTGPHLLRAKSNWQAVVPNDACESSQYGETEDYTANILSSSGIEENFSLHSDFKVQNHGDNQFTISLHTTNFQNRLTFTVVNMVGQELINYNLDNKQGNYTYNLDMSYANPGVYIVRIGNETQGKTQKIIVD